jgi:hypothetical protein
MTNDEVKFEANSPTEVVAWLRADSRTQVTSDAAYMADTAERVKAQMGLTIPTDSADEFVLALLKQGLLRRLKD